MKDTPKRLQTIIESKTETVISKYSCPCCEDHPKLNEKITTYSNGKKSSKLICANCNRGFKIMEVKP